MFSLFVTTTDRDPRSPARDPDAGVALFTTDNAGLCTIVPPPEVEAADTVRAGVAFPGGVGAWPEATALLTMRLPRSIPACVTTYGPPVQVNVPFGASG